MSSIYTATSDKYPLDIFNVSRRAMLVPQRCSHSRLSRVPWDDDDDDDDETRTSLPASEIVT